jgi:hypothetical protein
LVSASCPCNCFPDITYTSRRLAVMTTGTLNVLSKVRSSLSVMVIAAKTLSCSPLAVFSSRTWIELILGLPACPGSLLRNAPSFPNYNTSVVGRSCLFGSITRWRRPPPAAHTRRSQCDDPRCPQGWPLRARRLSFLETRIGDQCDCE